MQTALRAGDREISGAFHIEAFEAGFASERAALMAHPLFAEVHELGRMRRFMEYHVFAVWDFMSLLKTLQAKLTCVSTPWMPPANREAARFINEIVLGEETDEISPGRYISHFELYLEAMRECQADTSSIETFLARMARFREVGPALDAAGTPGGARAFVSATLGFCQLEAHEVAAAFLYGREDIIPDMFRRILQDPTTSGDPRLGKLKRYLERHIEVDGDSHGPMARRLMESLCGNDAAMWSEAGIVARAALKARHALWDSVLTELRRAV